MMFLVKRLDDFEGFKLVKEVKSKGIKIYMVREEGQKLMSIKLTVDKVKIPIFNLLCLIYET
jgi:hypothetical protein